jgi:hypothetical protein
MAAVRDIVNTVQLMLHQHTQCVVVLVQNTRVSNHWPFCLLSHSCTCIQSAHISELTTNDTNHIAYLESSVSESSSTTLIFLLSFC